MFTCYQSPDNSDRRELEQEIISKMLKREANYRETGSGALTLSEIAEGGRDCRFDIVDEWDYAAGSLILEEAGGKFEVMRPGTVIGTNGPLHEEFRKVVSDTLRNGL
jgi:fructose-1,6-bisphosphatase/inositol monophosphatase family enzyme